MFIDDKYTAHIASAISGSTAFFAVITLKDVQAWLTVIASTISILCGILAFTLYIINLYEKLFKNGKSNNKGNS